MSKLDLKGVKFDATELDEAEVSEDFEPYTGPVASKNTILAGYVKKLWVGQSQNGNVMFTNLFIADGNEGKNAVYNGMAIFDRVTFTPKASFHYKPWLHTFGITAQDITKADVADEDENNGTPVNKIRKFKPGEKARCRVLTGKEKYDDEFRNNIQKWLPESEADEADDDDSSSDDSAF